MIQFPWDEDTDINEDDIEEWGTPKLMLRLTQVFYPWVLIPFYIPGLLYKDYKQRLVKWLKA